MLKNKGNPKFSFFDLLGRHGILIWSKRAGILTIPKYHAYSRGRKMRISDSLYFYAIENVLIVTIFFTEFKNIEQPKRIKYYIQVSWVVCKSDFEIIKGSLCNLFVKAPYRTPI